MICSTVVPWFALIDPRNGRVIATSVAKDDGRNFAALADEPAIARFGEMLRASCKTISAAELEQLLASLREIDKKPA